jgi:hypothetical protein
MAPVPTTTVTQPASARFRPTSQCPGILHPAGMCLRASCITGSAICHLPAGSMPEICSQSRGCWLPFTNRAIASHTTNLHSEASTRVFAGASSD